jgi:hypothetical protein
MKASKIKSIIINEGIEQGSIVIQEEIHEIVSVRNAAITFIACIAFLSGMILMYFIEK